MTNDELVLLTGKGISALVAAHEQLDVKAEELNKEQQKAMETYQEAVQTALIAWRKESIHLGLKQRVVLENQAAIITAIKNLGLSSHA